MCTMFMCMIGALRHELNSNETCEELLSKETFLNTAILKLSDSNAEHGKSKRNFEMAAFPSEMLLNISEGESQCSSMCVRVQE